MADAIKLDNAVVDVDTDWEDETISKDLLKQGDINIDFSNMTSSLRPIIRQGSSVYVNGNIMIFDTDYEILGNLTIGVNYITIDEDAEFLPIASYTDTPPTEYSHIKGGFYDGVKRYVLIFEAPDGNSWVDKRFMVEDNSLYFFGNIELSNDISVGVDFNSSSNTTDVIVTDTSSLDITTENMGGTNITVSGNITCDVAIWTDSSGNRVNTFSGSSTSLTSSQWFDGVGYYYSYVLSSGIYTVAKGFIQTDQFSFIDDGQARDATCQSTTSQTITSSGGAVMKEIWEDK